ELWEAGGWYGVKGYFEWMETKTYKMHVRVFLSRYRAYKTCPTCHGARFQPEALNFHLGAIPSGGPATTGVPVLPGPAQRAGSDSSGLTLPEINQLPLTQARDFFASL